jgi:hypothetical protein
MYNPKFKDKINNEIGQLLHNQIDKLFISNPCVEIELNMEPLTSLIGRDDIVTRKVLFEKIDGKLRFDFDFLFNKSFGGLTKIDDNDLLLKSYITFLASRQVNL